MSDLIRNLRDLAAFAHADLSVAAEAAAEIERLRAALMQCKIIAEQYQKENEESSRWQGSGKAQMKARAVAVRCGFLVGSLRKVINAALSGARNE